MHEETIHGIGQQSREKPPAGRVCHKNGPRVVCYV